MFDPLYFLMIAPAMILAMWAQARVRSAYAQGMQVSVPLSGAAAARHVLDSAGLHQVDIEMIPGQLSDHYDPRAKVLRLSPEVFQERSAAAVGIAAHEAGHAIQDARAYAPLVIRNLAVPIANFGSGFSMTLFFIGLMMRVQLLVLAGIALFGTVVFFQLVNLPVEFDASRRAKAELARLGIVDEQRMVYVSRVLNAAGWTYVAATLQSIFTLLYLLLRASGSRSRD